MPLTVTTIFTHFILPPGVSHRFLCSSYSHCKDDELTTEDEDTVILKACYGGLIRKNDGRSKLGFFENVGISNILPAEIHVILIGVT